MWRWSFCTAILAVSWTTVLSIPLSNYTSLSPEERCVFLPETGSCQSFIHKWFYNSTTGKCNTFVYGGCDGNSNRFDTEAECLYVCSDEGEGHTLPPYLQRYYDKQPEEGDDIVEEEEESEERERRKSSTSSTTTERTASTKITTKYIPPWRTTTTMAPVPLEDRGEELTFAETGHHKVFMFAQSNTFIQLDGNRIPTFQLRLCREILFQFRTKLPHGLLVYHSVKDRPEGLDPYALYVIVEKGQLKVVHVFGKHSTSLTVGKGLNRDVWHSVMVRIDVHRARLLAKVDDEIEETNILGLHSSTNYGVTTDLTSVVLIGGLSPEEKLHGVKYIIESFVGCIKNMVLSSGKAASDLLPISPLIATKHENIVEGCISKCRTNENLCFIGSRCVNHYNGLTCDCFGRKYEGYYCNVYAATTLTLRGSSYVSYRVYDWRDRVHSSENRISMFFKTRFDDSALFYASGEPHGSHYIAASIKNGSVYVEVDFGDGPRNVSIGINIIDSYWHNLTIHHHSANISIYLDYEEKHLRLPGSRHHLYIDPQIYIAGGPELTKKKGLVSNNNFPGCLKYVFFNDVSILYELKNLNPKVHYHGVLEPEFKENEVNVIPITFSYPASHIWWPIEKMENLTISFYFSTGSNRSNAVLLSSEVTTTENAGYWEIRAFSDEIRFELLPNIANNITHMTTVKFENSGNWHSVQLIYSKGEVTLVVDYRHKVTQSFKLDLPTIGGKLLIGSGRRANKGLVGCIRELVINDVALDPRHLVRAENTVGEVSLDNCQLVDPCKRPDACEHGGKCFVGEDRVTCNCDGTGYIGKNCHFATYRRTCEELALLGYMKPDVYLIDIDGNGRFPPAHVKCEFESQSQEGSTKTIVEHNLPSQVDVRSTTAGDFSYNISYREFTGEMLQELISHSLHCSQYIKYDCYKAPLDLHSATWFISSAEKNNYVDHLGDIKRGACPCAWNRTCYNPEQPCNCDSGEDKWLSDEGNFNATNSLGITQMVFLQQKELEPDALGRMTLGPLECVEANTQKYVVTFTSSQSYIEVPGWRKGDISFSFRTTGEKAILLYQPPIRPHYPSFMVALTSDFALTFNFTLNTGRSREMKIISKRKLNGGEWQKIWIDYNEHHVRFLINSDSEMVDLMPDEEFGPFEGSMFIGGATDELLETCSVREGLIGCFRGLVVNGQILDIYSYMSVHLSEIIKTCRTSCYPNPCKNEAKCKELWGSFQCVCENPWAHSGIQCETNINNNGITFQTKESFVKRNILSNATEEDRRIIGNIFTQDVLINLRTYDNTSIVMYTNDHLNNFIQIHIQSGKYVVLMFNYGNEIQSLQVNYPILNNGKSTQIAVIRKEHETVLHVNEKNASLPIGVKLLTKYTNRPWSNPDKEILAPQRPPAPPTEYIQMNLGGYHPANLLSTGLNLPGYVGCIRGLKIGQNVLDLSAYVKPGIPEGDSNVSNEEVTSEIDEDNNCQYSSLSSESSDDSSNDDDDYDNEESYSSSEMQCESIEDMSGILNGCQMKCDEKPCKNQGVCIEDFQKRESTCICQHTSYYGDFCDEEKGAEFNGNAVVQRKYLLESLPNTTKVQLAFSSIDHRQQNRVLLLLQSENIKSYYLLVALSTKGEILIEEARDGRAFSARVVGTNFVNGGRHSVYYERDFEDVILLIDREEVMLKETEVLTLTGASSGESRLNELQVGGLNTSDPAFATFASYSGCISNVFVEVDSHLMKPLEEYMLFTKTGSQEVVVHNPTGVRSAQCAIFHAPNRPPPPPQQGPVLNMTLVNEKEWSPDPPARIAYKTFYTEMSTEEDGSTQVVFLVFVGFFCFVVTCALLEVYRNHRKYKRRKAKEAKAALLWHRSQSQKKPDSKPKPKSSGYKSVPQQETKVHFSDKDGKQEKQQPVKSESVQDSKDAVPNNVPTTLEGQEQELEWEPLKNASDLAAQSLEDLANDMQNELDREEKGSSPDKVEQNNSTTFPPIAEDEVSNLIDIPPVGFHFAPPARMAASLSPVFLSEQQRTFDNPISYLGGPRIASPKVTRASKESVLSLD